MDFFPISGYFTDSLLLEIIGWVNFAQCGTFKELFQLLSWLFCFHRHCWYWAISLLNVICNSPYEPLLGSLQTLAFCLHNSVINLLRSLFSSTPLKSNYPRHYIPHHVIPLHVVVRTLLLWCGQHLHWFGDILGGPLRPPGSADTAELNDTFDTITGAEGKGGVGVAGAACWGGVPGVSLFDMRDIKARLRLIR